MILSWIKKKPNQIEKKKKLYSTQINCFFFKLKLIPSVRWDETVSIKQE